MSFDAYMWLETPQGGAPPVQGETTDAVHAAKKAFEIFSFSWGASNPVSIGSGTGGAGAGKVSISSFNVMKRTDNASPNLFAACSCGGHYGKANVVLRKAGGTKDKTGSVYITYTFSKVFVESIQWSGSSGGDDYPTESVSFAFGACKIQYWPQKATGEQGTVNEKMWSVIQNVASEAV
jgi:type VI secretion system secreted protein Hcp